MIGFVFENVLDNNAYVISREKEKHEVVFEFVGIDAPKKGDKIIIHQDLLNKYSASYTQPYAFELAEVNPKVVTEGNDREYIIISTDNKIYTLKRIYG